MALNEDLRARLINGFRAELADYLRVITEGLLALEQPAGANDQATVLEDIFRAAHNLKGTARAMGITPIEQLAHSLEDVLNALQKNALVPSAALFTACYQVLDAIQLVPITDEASPATTPPEALHALTALNTFLSEASPAGDQTTRSVDLAANPEAAVTAGPAPVTANRPIIDDDTIRISAHRLDQLMADLGELLVTKIKAEQRLDQMRQTLAVVSNWRKDWADIRHAYSRLSHALSSPEVAVNRQLLKDVIRLVNYVEGDRKHWREVDVLLGGLLDSYAADTLHMSLAIDEMEQGIKQARLLPLNTITDSFGRMVRDLAQAAGKEATLHISGSEVELDKHMLERIKDPLIHLLRNAVDHGIELPQQREEIGKPRSGTITLKAEQADRAVTIQVADDGAGLNMQAIQEAAVRLGQSGVGAERWSEADLVEMIFTPGLSTQPAITSTSGRGVGLDVVHRNVEALNGRINVDWTAGGGTTFTLTLPLTLMSSRGLLVRASNELFAIPISAIDRALRVQPEQIISIGGRDALYLQGRSVMLVHLGDVLSLPRSNPVSDHTALSVIIVAAADRRLALAIDELVGEQEIVSRGLGKQLLRVGGISGASVLANGEALLILNVADLINLAAGHAYRSVIEVSTETAPVAPVTRRRILVVDDSVTTRTLEKNILEAADGLEALNMIAVSQPDLVISDAAMPRLDGFGLTHRIKHDEHIQHLPVILVTSLSSPDDQARGIAAGADAYIVKSSFNQTDLLETIEQLI